MAEKQPIIVIKKVTVNQAGGHGGSWKVAFADFMTSMMAFFLVMWLISQSAQVKKNVSDYFSTPSVIEYDFSNFGAELTLEKMFLDLVNEPLKFLHDYLKPADFTPNLMAMGSRRVVIHYVAEQLGGVAQEVEVNEDEIKFKIPDKYMFKPGTGIPTGQFVSIMTKISKITNGLEDSNIFIDSQLYYQSVADQSATTARNVAQQRLDMVSQKIQRTLEHPTVDVFAKTDVAQYTKPLKAGAHPGGFIVVRIKQKEKLSNGRKPRKLQDVFGASDPSMSVYDNFVHKLTTAKKK